MDNQQRLATGVVGTCILLVLVLWPTLVMLAHTRTPCPSFLALEKLSLQREEAQGWHCGMQSPVHWQVENVFSQSWQGPALTYDHVLQRMLGQPAVEKHRDEQVPKRWPEDLWCVGERSGGVWGAELGAGAHPP